MKQNKHPTKKYPKLRGRSRKLASKFIAEEIRAGIPQRQAVAIGISRARAAQKKTELDKIIARYL